ncbi:hypothetical protein [Solibacillus isronensis]|uniref:hypothetical protein n=1 Tax=Solibacillus isronensis TaxID=412383 RepID=UPI0039A10A3D
MAEKIFIADKPTLDIVKGTVDEIRDRKIASLVSYNGTFSGNGSEVTLLEVNGRGKILHAAPDYVNRNIKMKVYIDGEIIWISDAFSGSLGSGLISPAFLSTELNTFYMKLVGRSDRKPLSSSGMDFKTIPFIDGGQNAYCIMPNGLSFNTSLKVTGQISSSGSYQGYCDVLAEVYE